MTDAHTGRPSTKKNVHHGMNTLSFAHLNLRKNPFGQLWPSERGALAVIDLPEIVSGEVLQYIGRSGRGKSTHLQGLASAFAEARYEYVPKGQHHFLTSSTDCDFLLLDEAQRLFPRELQRLFSAFPKLVLGTHWSLSLFSRRRFQTKKIRGLSLQKLRLVVDKRIDWARRNAGPVPFLEDPELLLLIDRYGDDLRSMESFLYDVFQNLHAPERVLLEDFF